MLSLAQNVQAPGQSTPSHTSALDKLVASVKKRRGAGQAVEDFGKFEEHLHERVMAIERELVAEELARADIDEAAIEIDGEPFRRVVRSMGHYQTAAGVVHVERTLYKNCSTKTPGRAVSALDKAIGVVDGRWTPLAAKQASWIVAHMTPTQGEELLMRLGNMTPSKSSLGRLPKELSQRWEKDRAGFEEALQGDEHVPEKATIVAISLDGVMAPMREGQGPDKRSMAAKNGQLTRGPAGYREIGCGTLSFYDNRGELLRTVRIGRMPESKKATLKSMLKVELGRALAERPELTLIAVADGAKDNWSYLQNEVIDELPEQCRKVAILDFYHAAEHLNEAFGAAYGEGSVEARTKFATYRHILLEDPKGVEKAIGALSRLKKRHPKKKKIATVLAYLRTHRHMMRYAEYKAAKLPIGSGIIEAACKTLVTQRMKNSGMRWGREGGQAVLTMRGWAQSERFDRAWALSAATYKAEIHTFKNIVAFPGMP